MKRVRYVVGLLVLAGVVFSAPVSAVDLKEVLKDGAVIVGGGALVTAIAGPINDFINTVTFNRGVKANGYTKVVPIVSMGTGAHIGGAQVGGNSKSAVERTKAVAQLETKYKGVRAKILVPIDSVNPLKQFKRVQGIGVTAIIDVKI